MGHIQSVEQEFRQLLAQGDQEALVRFVKDQVNISYRNGLAGIGQASRGAATKGGTTKKDNEESITS